MPDPNQPVSGQPCVLCDSPQVRMLNNNAPGDMEFECPRCGHFWMTFEAWQNACNEFHPFYNQRYLVSGLCRLRSVRGSEPLFLTRENLDDLPAQAPTGHLERVDQLLLSLAAVINRDTSGRNTAEIQANTAYPLVFGRSDGDFVYFAQMLIARDLLNIHSGTIATGHFRLTWQGWERVRSSSTNAFVVMSFHPDFDLAFDKAIEPGIKLAGFKAIRADREHPEGKLDDFIMAGIKSSRFVVADLSGHRPNAYFEAGYALGLGIPIIWTCRAVPDLEALHFDAKMYPFLAWMPDEFDDFRDRLTARIGVRIT